MSNNHYYKIEQYLDIKLGRWSRLCPWREELLEHLNQLCEKEYKYDNDHETAWERALEQFGDVNEIASELKRLYRPENIVTRLIIILISAGFIAWAVGGAMSAFVHTPAVLLLVLPMFICSMAVILSNNFRLKNISLYCNASLCAGAVTGILLAILNFSDPSKLGPAMALTLLCNLYAILFVNIDTKTNLFLIITNIFIMVLLLFSFMSGCYLSVCNFNYFFIWEQNELLRLFIITTAGLSAGWARWGTERLPLFLIRISVGIMTVYLISCLQSLSSVDYLFASIILSFIPVVIFALFQKALISTRLCK